MTPSARDSARAAHPSGGRVHRVLSGGDVAVAAFAEQSRAMVPKGRVGRSAGCREKPFGADEAGGMGVLGSEKGILHRHLALHRVRRDLPYGSALHDGTHVKTVVRCSPCPDPQRDAGAACGVRKLVEN
ncbi:MAG: hypothetical protein Q8K20_20305 [Gemmobacter sp.]|nr:hypothetical protein [Gemmobacter sp.]